MAKSKKNTGLIVGICAAIVAIVLIIVAIIFAANNRLNDSYFVSDNTKYVLTVDSDGTATNEEYSPLKTHLVYTYSGDEITGLKLYYEYADNATAETAYNHFKDNLGENYKSINMEGKYVILEANPSEYEGITASDVKQQIEFIESLKNTGTTESENGSTIPAEEEVVEPINETTTTESTTEEVTE